MMSLRLYNFAEGSRSRSELNTQKHKGSSCQEDILNSSFTSDWGRLWQSRFPRFVHVNKADSHRGMRRLSVWTFVCKFSNSSQTSTNTCRHQDFQHFKTNKWTPCKNTYICACTVLFCWYMLKNNQMSVKSAFLTSWNLFTRRFLLKTINFRFSSPFVAKTQRNFQNWNHT